MLVVIEPRNLCSCKKSLWLFNIRKYYFSRSESFYRLFLSTNNIVNYYNQITMIHDYNTCVFFDLITIFIVIDLLSIDYYHSNILFNNVESTCSVRRLYVWCIVYIVHGTTYYVHCTTYSVRRTAYSLHCIASIWRIYYILYHHVKSGWYIMYSVSSRYCL